MRERAPLLAGLVCLAIAVGVGSSFIAGGIRDRNRGGDRITVTGSAKQRISSDYVVWDASLTARAADPGPAAAQLRKWTQQVEAFLSAHGVSKQELVVDPIQTLTPGQFSEDTGRVIKDYELTRSFEVRSSRVDGVAALAEASSSLLTSGVPLAADPPAYSYTKLPSLRPQLIRAAIKDAQRRAQVLVDATGAHLGKVRGVDVGVFQVTAPNSTAVSDYGEYDTSSREKDVTGVVNVTFAIS